MADENYVMVRADISRGDGISTHSKIEIGAVSPFELGAAFGALETRLKLIKEEAIAKLRAGGPRYVDDFHAGLLVARGETPTLTFHRGGEMKLGKQE